MNLICIVTCFDDYSRLSLTLNSLLAVQFSFPVYVKDASSASSFAIEELAVSFSSSLDIHFLSSPDSSIYDGMNQALLWVLGEIIPSDSYIWFLNCGDMVNCFSSLFFDELLSNHPSPNWCATSVLLSPSGRLLDVPKRFLRRLFPTQRMVYCHQGVFIRGDVISTNYFDPSFPVSADYLQLLNIESVFGRPLLIDSACILYDEVGFSSSQSSFARHLEECKVVLASRFSLPIKCIGLAFRIPRLAISLLRTVFSLDFCR